MTDMGDRFNEDELRRLGLYVDHTQPTIVDGPTGPIEVLVVDCTIGDVAFTDRVIEPERDTTDTTFREMEAAMLTDGFLDAHEQMRRNIAAGRNPLDDDVICRHCQRLIVNVEGTWVDPEATGDDLMWRETCDSNNTFEAHHEPEENDDD